MKLVRLAAVLMALSSTLLVMSCATQGTKAQGGARDTLYVCGCGDSCKCTAVSTKAGKCGCGHNLVAGKVKKVEGDEALLCTCGEACGCTLSASDPARCGCGKPIRRVSLKGTGIYFCNCGGSCTCNTVSATPSKCKCGMDLKKAI